MRLGRAGIALVVVLATFAIKTPGALASISSCSDAEVTPHSAAPNSTTSYDVRLRNTDVNSIAWIDIRQPTGHYNIVAADFSWDTEVTSDTVSLSGGSLASNATLTGTVTVETANVNVSQDNWIIKVSDSPNGPGVFFCSGSLDASIEGQLADQSGPQLSGLKLSGLTDRSVNLAWISDEPATSVVNFGRTEEYGQVKSQAGLTTNHNLTLTELTADTVYYFELAGTDASNNTGNGESGTFLTAAAAPTPQLTIPQVVQNIITANVPLTPGRETIAPRITLTTNLSGVYAVVPEMSGVATDNEALARVDYSIDGGVNWLKADQTSGLGGPKVAFSFTPIIQDDGNYDVVARAIDASLNVSMTPTQTLVIDTGAPVIGGVVTMSGAHLLIPDNDGAITTAPSLVQRISLNAIGGATDISLKTVSAESGNQDSSTQSFALTRSRESGLWNGVLNFQDPGRFHLVAEAVDGAHNRSSTIVSTANVLSAGKVTEAGTGKPISEASVTLYTFEPTSGAWLIWDGSAYGQNNPQLTSSDGQYSLLAPEGRYYLEIGTENQSFRRARSRIFTLKYPSVITQSVSLKKGSKLKVGKLVVDLPKIMAEHFTVEVANTEAKRAISTVSLPKFELETTSHTPLRDTDLLGKLTVISAMNSWSPVSQEQLSALEKLAEEYRDINVVPIFLLEPVSLLSVYQKIGGFNLRLVSDKSGQIASLSVSRGTPIHYFVNHTGSIKKTVGGVLSKEQLVGELLTEQ